MASAKVLLRRVFLQSSHRLQEEFRRRIKTQASLPSEKAALLLFFGLFASGQVKMHRIEG
jgi:hypothetical protein